MAKYRVLELSFIKDALQPEGTILELPDEFDPSYNLEPLDDAAWAARERWEAAEDSRRLGSPPQTVDPFALADIAAMDAKGRAIKRPGKSAA